MAPSGHTINPSNKGGIRVIKSYYFDHENDTMLHDVDLSRIDELLASPDSLLWIDLYDCAVSELHYIGEVF